MVGRLCSGVRRKEGRKNKILRGRGGGLGDLPFIPLIRVRILLKPKVFPLKCCLKRTKINNIEAWVGPFKK